jgi:chemotaxis protein MotA
MNILLSVFLAICSLLFIFTIFNGIGISMIFNLDAFLIVIGGTTIAMFLGFPVNRIRITVNEIIDAFSIQRNRDSVIDDILVVSRMYGKTDIRTLENRIRSFDDNFLKMGATLLINDHSKKELKNIMEREMMLRLINFNFSQNLLRTVARLAPSFGLAGTVISLIKMFKHLESVEAIAPMMAVALMSTFYGIIIANLFMLPLCAKLKEKAIESESVMTITIEGILLIRNNEHPLKIEEKIKEYKEIDDAYQPAANNTLVVNKGTA